MRIRLTIVQAALIVTTACGASIQGQVAPWEPAPGVLLTADSQVFDIVVMEQGCSGGDTAEGRVEDQMVYEDRAVVVTIRVDPKPGFQNCPSNPPTCHRLFLDEPLGSRDLLMGGLGDPRLPDVGFIGPINCLN